MEGVDLTMEEVEAIEKETELRDIAKDLRRAKRRKKLIAQKPKKLGSKAQWEMIISLYSEVVELPCKDRKRWWCNECPIKQLTYGCKKRRRYKKKPKEKPGKLEK